MIPINLLMSHPYTRSCGRSGCNEASKWESQLASLSAALVLISCLGFWEAIYIVSLLQCMYFSKYSHRSSPPRQTAWLSPCIDPSDSSSSASKALLCSSPTWSCAASASFFPIVLCSLAVWSDSPVTRSICKQKSPFWCLHSLDLQ